MNKFDIVLNDIIELHGVSIIVENTENISSYSHDETGVYSNAPVWIARPHSSIEVSNILRLCNEHDVQVNVWGRGTGLAGGSIPVGQAITMDLSKLDKIIHFSPVDSTILVEAGVLTAQLNEYLIPKGFYYPVDPASAGICSIGGNIATNAAGPHSLKYGTTRQYVLNLKAVMMDGSIINSGAQTEKNSSGLSFTQLITGSEGQLVVVTEALLKIIPYPTFRMSLILAFDTLSKGLNAVSLLRNSRCGFSAIEFMEKNAIEVVYAYSPNDVLSLEDNVNCLILAEIDAYTSEELLLKQEVVLDLVQNTGQIQDFVADDDKTQADLWKIRKLIGHAVRQRTSYREVDTIVPISHLSGLIQKVKEIGAKYGFESICYGHAGNGNLHINILKDDLSESKWVEINQAAVGEIFSFVVSAGGAISGEHGIGVLNRPFMGLQYDQTELSLMKDIKAVFDRKNLLNTGKVF